MRNDAEEGKGKKMFKKENTMTLCTKNCFFSLSLSLFSSSLSFCGFVCAYTPRICKENFCGRVKKKKGFTP